MLEGESPASGHWLIGGDWTVESKTMDKGGLLYCPHLVQYCPYGRLYPPCKMCLVDNSLLQFSEAVY